MPAPTCKTCDTGTLNHRKIHRMSPVVVFIGWVLLIPSILGIVGAAIGAAITVSGAAAVSAGDHSAETRPQRVEEAFGARFDEVGLSREYLVRLTNLDGENVEIASDDEIASMTREQRDVLADATTFAMRDRVSSGAAALGGAMGIFVFGLIGVGSLVSGLLGWLLVMKKKVLQCTNCGAVVAAS